MTLDVSNGQRLGCYELLVPLGAGGMASVWVARRTSARGFQKLVAIKLMHEDLRSQGVYERMFLDEARLAARIRHPNVAQIHDLGEEDGLLYQVMEWVDGEPLSAVLGAFSGRPLPLPIVLQIGIQAAAGLHAAHQLRNDEGAPVGLIHRDVSPQNILVGFDGTVKVVDFGVAKASCNTEQTAAGYLKGKVAYMSPEQVQGFAINRRTDVFALGSVLYLMATGRHPFQGETDVQTIGNLMHPAPVVPPRARIPGFPEALNAAICAALHKDPDERCASMADLMRALEEAIPAQEQVSSQDLGAFMRNILGEQRRKRHCAIHEVRRGSHPEDRLSLVDPIPPSHPPCSEPAVPAASADSPAAPVEPTRRSRSPHPTQTSAATMRCEPPLPARRRAGVRIAAAALAVTLGAAVGFLGSRASEPPGRAREPTPATDAPQALPEGQDARVPRCPKPPPRRAWGL